MNDSELISRLKDVRPPERSTEYWDDFPSRVRVQLRPVSAMRKGETRFFPRLAWVGGLAFACLVLNLTLWPAHFILKNEKTLSREFAQLPDHLRIFMADEHGLHYLIAEKE